MPLHLGRAGPRGSHRRPGRSRAAPRPARPPSPPRHRGRVPGGAQGRAPRPLRSAVWASGSFVVAGCGGVISTAPRGSRPRHEQAAVLQLVDRDATTLVCSWWGQGAGLMVRWAEARRTGHRVDWVWVPGSVRREPLQPVGIADLRLARPGVRERLSHDGSHRRRRGGPRRQQRADPGLSHGERVHGAGPLSLHPHPHRGGLIRRSEASTSRGRVLPHVRQIASVPARGRGSAGLAGVAGPPRSSAALGRVSGRRCVTVASPLRRRCLRSWSSRPPPPHPPGARCALPLRAGRGRWGSGLAPRRVRC